MKELYYVFSLQVLILIMQKEKLELIMDIKIMIKLQ